MGEYRIGRRAVATRQGWRVFGSAKRRPIHGPDAHTVRRRSACGGAVVTAALVLATGAPAARASTFEILSPAPPTVSASTTHYVFATDADTASAAASAPSGSSVYTAVPPTRILDSRIGLGVPARLGQFSSFVVGIGGVAPVPAGATAVVINVTATDPAGPGFTTAWPADQPQPTTSIINYQAPGQTIANLVTVPMDANGRVAFFTSRAVDLIADVQGYYTAAASGTAGRLVVTLPTRVLDTRSPNPIAFGTVQPGHTVDIDFKPYGVAADALAVVLKVTVTEATAAGYWTAFASGTTRPTASNLNVTTSGQTIPNQVITPISAGSATIFSQSGGHLIVDLVGWYTGASAADGTAGLFVPVRPNRLVDTRDPANGPNAEPGANQQIEVAVNGRADIPATGVSAVLVNATVTNTKAAGFFTLWPSRTPRPTISSLNAMTADQTLANHVITPVTATGFEFYTQSGAHLIADVMGWYTGTPSETTPAPIVPVPPIVPPAPVPPPVPSEPPDVGGYIFKLASIPGGGTLSNQAAPGSTPFHWNSCTPIRYAIDMNGYAELHRATITEAIARVAAATGLQFVNVADSTFIPKFIDPWGFPVAQFESGAAPYDMIISLADEQITDVLAGNTIGFTQTDSTFRAAREGRFFVSAVSIDVGAIGTNPEWSGNGVGPVLLHELAHAVGLGHVTDAAQIMFPAARAQGPTTYAAGDLRGLWLEGSVRGCTGF